MEGIKEERSGDEGNERTGIGPRNLGLTGGRLTGPLEEAPEVTAAPPPGAVLVGLLPVI
jgi:hypothetical protein